jgi:micrococcal nuclease
MNKSKLAGSLKPKPFKAPRPFRPWRWVVIALLAVVVFTPDEWLGPFKQFVKGPGAKHAAQSQQEPSIEELERSKQVASVVAPSNVVLDNLTEWPREKRLACKVLTLIDGDTIGCDINGNGTIESPSEKIRLLQVDTPETKKSKRNPSGEPQPFGLEAQAFTKAHTLNKVVYLQFDKKIRDPYGRTLAFVYLNEDDTESLNEQLLKNGLATIMMYSPNYAKRDVVKNLQLQAQELKLGLWGSTSALTGGQ